jgi:hypothetical protein
MPYISARKALTILAQNLSFKEKKNDMSSFYRLAKEVNGNDSLKSSMDHFFDKEK